VIAAEGPLMGNPFLTFGRRIYQTMAGFFVRFRLYQWEENTLAK
jgi:hypothetical protein